MMFIYRIFFIATGVLCIFLTSSISAERAYEHNGFLFRILAGAGNSELLHRPPTDAGNTIEYKAKSVSPFFTLYFGRAATQNFIIHISTFYTYNLNREAELISSDTRKIEGAKSQNLKFRQNYVSYGAGMGFIYYLPWNISFSSEYRSAVFSRLESRLTSNNITEPYAYEKAEMEGHGMGVTFGKEFWVSNEIGIGFSAVYNIDWLGFTKYEFREETNNTDQAFTSTSIRDIGRGAVRHIFWGLALSITYN